MVIMYQIGIKNLLKIIINKSKSNQRLGKWGRIKGKGGKFIYLFTFYLFTVQYCIFIDYSIK